MKKLLSLLLVLVMCLSFVACGTNNETATADTATTEATTAPVSKGSTPLLYKATSENGGEVWLFGSIHVGNDDMYPLPDYVNNAYNEADSLAVEVDSDGDLVLDILQVKAVLVNDEFAAV